MRSVMKGGIVMRSAVKTAAYAAGACALAVVMVACDNGGSNPVASSAVPAGSGPGTLEFTAPSGNGQWTLSGPDGLPQVGCVTMDDLDAMDLPKVMNVEALQWQVQVPEGNSHPIRIVPLAFHKDQAGCEPTDGHQARRLITTGPSQYVAGETGTTTLTWLTDRCKDGGRYGINVQVISDYTDENPATDRQGAQLVVNCGFDTGSRR